MGDWPEPGVDVEGVGMEGEGVGETWEEVEVRVEVEERTFHTKSRRPSGRLHASDSSRKTMIFGFYASRRSI